ncbi:hypothetical protein [Acinetobacter guillouiae]|uniref:hypothetical protein n=1 Tax=Acinetobacter guillouiae TaxID=106649 RepID=UPI003AF603CA
MEYSKMPKANPYTPGQYQTGGNQNQNQYNDNEARALQAAYSTVPEQSTTPAHDPIALMLEDLAGKTGALKFGTDDHPRYIPTIAASITTVGFSEVVPSPVMNNNTLANMLFADDKLKAAVYKASSYLSAGVQLATIADPNAETTREIIHAQHTYCTAEPLNYEFVAEGQEVTSQSSPFDFKSFKIAEEASVGASFTLSRRTLKDTPAFALNGLLYDAIAGGIGRAIDKAMSAHLGSLTLSPFTLGAVAARGLNMGDIIGVTSGTSTDAILDRGELFLKGVNAHLCAATGSYIFAPSKFAVAVPQDLRLTAKRDNKGGTEFTIWTNIEVLATAQSNTAVWTA